MSAQRDPTEMQELTRLISTSNSTSIYPTDDSILSLLHARFRHDQPYTRLAPSSSTFIIVNPFKHMRNLDDESQREYKARSYDATDHPTGKPSLQPHPYQLAANIYSFMRRRNQAQAVVFRSVHRLTTSAHFSFRPCFPSLSFEPNGTRLCCPSALFSFLPCLHLVVVLFSRESTANGLTTSQYTRGSSKEYSLCHTTQCHWL